MNPQSEHSKIPFAVILFLGGVSVILCVGLLLLAYLGKPIDNGLSTLAGGSIGALASVLANTRGTMGTQTPQAPIPVTTEPGKPLETVDASDSPTIAAKLPPTTGGTPE